LLTIHKDPVCEIDPRVMLSHSTRSNAEALLTAKTIKGNWFRVFPKTAQDVIRLQDLEHHIDKHTPATGGGVFISQRALESLIVIDIRSQKANLFA